MLGQRVIGALKGTLEWAFGDIGRVLPFVACGIGCFGGYSSEVRVSSILKKAGFVDCSTFW
jgi:hypothetical protein